MARRSCTSSSPSTIPYYYRSPIQGSLTSTPTPTPMKLKNEYSLAFLTDGVTAPFPYSLTHTLANIYHAPNKPTWLPVTKRSGQGLHAVQSSFGRGTSPYRWVKTAQAKGVGVAWCHPDKIPSSSRKPKPPHKKPDYYCWAIPQGPKKKNGVQFCTPQKVVPQGSVAHFLVLSPFLSFEFIPFLQTS